MDKRYTIRDIARLSGFSFKTVSRVINGEPNVKPDTRAKIMQVIADTNFKPNLYAKNLTRKKQTNILVSIRKMHDQNTTQWFDIFMSHFTRVSRDRSYTIIQEVVYGDDELAHSMMENSGGFIDVIVLFYLEEQDKRIEIARRNGIPFLSFEKNGLVPVSISNNNRKGVLDAASFLFGRGLTRICLLLGGLLDVNREREKALIEAYETHGVPLDRLEVVYHMNNLEKIRCFVDASIEAGRLPDVFFVSGDEKAIAVYNAVNRRGLSIPGDVSVIGFDNLPMSDYYSPPLTTMGQNFERLAVEMANVIDKLLRRDPDIPPIEIDPKLIVRESVK